MVKNNYIKFDFFWFIFFSSIFCFYTVPWVQFFPYIFILMYVIISLFKNKKYIVNLKKILFTSIGYLMLVFIAFLSRKWAYGFLPDSSTFNAMLKILLTVICLSIYIDNIDDFISVFLSFLYSLFIMSVLILFTSPISTYGTTLFGGITHQFRNSIANICFFAIPLTWFLSDNLSKKKSILFFLTFLITGLATGSRRGIVELILIVGLFVLTEKNTKTRTKSIIISAIVIFASVLIFSNFAFFQNTYFSRFSQIFNTSISDADFGDKSTIGRNIYRKIGIEMIKEHPIKGYGIDGFHCYLLDHPFTYTVSRLNATYSHCNYIELLVDFGLFGFLSYYIFIHFRLISSSLFKVKLDKIYRLTFIIIVSTFILDYGGISFSSSYNVILYCFLLIGNFLYNRHYDLLNDKNND